MKIDIEQLNRKMPYEEPSDAFFKTIQDHVLAKTLGEKPAAKKAARIFALNLRWAAAAAVVLIAGLTAFFSLNENPDMLVAQQKPIVDSTYEILPSETISNKSPDPASQPEPVEINKAEQKEHSSVAKLSKSQNRNPGVYDNADRQDYATDYKIKPEAEVEKVLAAFTPDQLKDLEKNSEQDVYLDLYN